VPALVRTNYSSVLALQTHPTSNDMTATENAPDDLISGF